MKKSRSQLPPVAGAARLAALVLAAGHSSRMGDFKPLLTVGRCTALQSAIRLFRESGVEDMAVIVGYRADEVSPVALRAGACCVLNPDHETGMFSSVVAGVRWLPSYVEACFILPADMPLVRPGTVRQMTAEFLRSKAPILYPVFNGRRGHPPLVVTRILAEALGAEPPASLRDLLRRHESEARPVVVDDEGIILDMDTPGDLERLRALAAARGKERS